MRLRVEGSVATPRELDPSSLGQLSAQVADLGEHLPGREGRGVWLRAILDAVGVAADARYVTLGAADGRFAVSVPLAAVADRAIVVYGRGSAPLPVAAGGPIRIYVVRAVTASGEAGEIDACANVKNLGLIRLTREREPDVGHDHG